jgi:hypothetical protein
MPRARHSNSRLCKDLRICSRFKVQYERRKGYGDAAFRLSSKLGARCCREVSGLTCGSCRIESWAFLAPHPTARWAPAVVPPAARNHHHRVLQLALWAWRTGFARRVVVGPIGNIHSPLAFSQGGECISDAEAMRTADGTVSRRGSPGALPADERRTGRVAQRDDCAATRLVVDVGREGALTDGRYPNATTVQRRLHRRKSECGIDRHVDRGELSVRSCAKAQRRVSLPGVVHGRRKSSPHMPRSCSSGVRRFADR